MSVFRILLVDDDPFVLYSLVPYLETEGYEVIGVDNGEEAIELFRVKSFDMVITDLFMEGVDGIDVLKAVRAVKQDILVIILTGYGDMTSAIDALRLNADDYMLKPCEPEEILSRVARCINKKKGQQRDQIYELALKHKSLTREEVDFLLEEPK